MTGVQIAVRPTSVASFRLPVIQHPISRLGDPETISLRGYSSGRAKDADVCGMEKGRPLSQEEHVPILRSHTSKTNRFLRPEKDPWMDTEFPIRPPLHIPEGVQVTAAADPDKPRLPLFGQRAATVSRAESLSSWTSGRASIVSCPEAKLRIQVDELEHELRQRLRGGGSAHLRCLFTNNNPDGKARVNKDVLLVILTKFLGRFINVRQFRQLLLRLHLSEKGVIMYDELCAVLSGHRAGPRQAFSLVRQPSSPALWTAFQVHSLLQGPSQDRFLDAVASFQLRGSIMAPQLKKVLEQLEVNMENQEFVKLWKRYDEEGFGSVRLDVLLKKLGTNFRKRSNSDGNNDEKAEINTKNTSSPGQALSKAEEERKASIEVETWLKGKFREGAQNMKAEFEKVDVHNSGKVQPEGFMQVLRTFGLNLRPNHLWLFLARCGMEAKKAGIDYREFVRKFQDRSDDGVLHRILCNPKHKFHVGVDTSSRVSSVTTVEAQLAHLFQGDYLELLETFRSIDKFGKKTVSQQEFRAILESRFQLEITDPQFEQLLDNLPLDEDGNVQYLLFMAAFDTRGGAPSLFGSRAKWGGDPTMCITEQRRTESIEAGLDRSTIQLFAIIKNLVRRDFPAVQEAYEQLDKGNTRRMTQEDVFQLLKRFSIQPEVSRGEIRRLWGTLITNHDKTLDFLQFVRHFGHSPKSACYPNAKVSPPTRGDADLRRYSKKLNTVSDILVDGVRAKVELLYHDLQGEFEEMDPYRTGFVSQEEFTRILRDLCAHLNEHECYKLGKKFDINGDGRVSYVDLLKPFLWRAQERPHGSNVAAVLRSSEGQLTERPLREKLQEEGRTLRRAFRKLDRMHTGLLPPAEFWAILKLHSITPDNEDVGRILAQYNQLGDGLVDYRRFLKEECGCCTRRSSMVSSSTAMVTSWD